MRSFASFLPHAGIFEDTILEGRTIEGALKTLELTGGNKSEAARRLGVTRKTLHKKLKMYGVMS